MESTCQERASGMRPSMVRSACLSSVRRSMPIKLQCQTPAIGGMIYQTAFSCSPAMGDSLPRPHDDVAFLFKTHAGVQISPQGHAHLAHFPREETLSHLPHSSQLGGGMQSFDQHMIDMVLRCRKTAPPTYLHPIIKLIFNLNDAHSLV